MVRARSLRSMSSWSHAATYQQFFRNPCVSGPIAAFLESFGARRFQKFYDVRGRKFRRDELAIGMQAPEVLGAGEFLEVSRAGRELHLGIDHPGLVAEDGDRTFG